MMADVEPQPESEPTCGHETVSAEDEDTIIAEPDNQDPPQDLLENDSPNQASKPSLNAPCAIDCCSLAWISFNRPNRDLRGLVSRKAATHQFTHKSKPRISPFLRHTSRRFHQPIPRGPPNFAQLKAD